MRHLRRSRLSILGIPVLIIVSLYVFFDLLDVDGSDFHRGRDAYTYEKKVAGDETDYAKRAVPAGPISQEFLPPPQHAFPTGLKPASLTHRPPPRNSRWRRATASEAAPRMEGSEPPIRPA